MAVLELPVSTRNMTGVLDAFAGTETYPGAKGALSNPCNFSIRIRARNPPWLQDPDCSFVGDELYDDDAEITSPDLLEMLEDRVLILTDRNYSAFVYCYILVEILSSEFRHVVGDPMLVRSGFENPRDSNFPGAPVHKQRGESHLAHHHSRSALKCRKCVYICCLRTVLSKIGW